MSPSQLFTNEVHASNNLQAIAKELRSKERYFQQDPRLLQAPGRHTRARSRQLCKIDLPVSQVLSPDPSSIDSQHTNWGFNLAANTATSCPRTREVSCDPPSRSNHEESSPKSLPEPGIQAANSSKSKSGAINSPSSEGKGKKVVGFSNKKGASIVSSDSIQEVGDQPSQKTSKKKSRSISSMSSQRNRPSRGASRGQSVQGGFPGEEADIWMAVQKEMRDIGDKELRIETLKNNITRLENEIKDKGGNPSAQDIRNLEDLYRESYKLSESVRSIIGEQDVGVLHKIKIISACFDDSGSTAVPSSRGASSRDNHRATSSMEIDGAIDSPSASPVVERSRGRDRLLSAGRSSVPREPSVKNEGVDTPTTESSSKNSTKITYTLGSLVAFRPKPHPGMEDPDWIKGIVIKVMGDNKTRRYDVQDAEDDDNSGKPGPVFRTSASSMVPIPKEDDPMPEYPKGKTVLAQYPHTTTFYRAEVVSTDGTEVTLKFEGEDDAQSTQVVHRRFVLDHRGKVGQ